MKDIKNARLYIGCVDCEYYDPFKKAWVKQFYGEPLYADLFSNKFNFKLLLRPLSDMSEEEKAKSFVLGSKSQQTGNIEDSFKEFLYLIEHGFDLGLIPDENVKLITK